MSAVGALIGVAGSAIQTGINYGLSRGLSDYDRERNHELNEEAARNADTRTRALYTDFYSPEALMRQYKAAGLSPSMMFGGTPGQGGVPGAQGGGSNTQTAFAPISLLEGVQAANIAAQTEKIKAETKNIEKDTDIKNLLEEWQTMINNEKSPEWRIFGSHNTKGISLYEEAEKHKTFDSFLKWYENDTKSNTTEYERRALQKVYTASYYLDREVSKLTNEKTSADFYKKVTLALQKADFENINAESTIQYLKQNVETNKLDEQQKKAWNDLLNRVGKKSETGKDVLLIIGMILDKALTQYRLPNIETGGKTININKQ